MYLYMYCDEKSWWFSKMISTLIRLNQLLPKYQIKNRKMNQATLSS